MSKLKKLMNIAFIGTVTATTIYLLNRTVNYLACKNERLYSPNGHFYHWRFGNIFYTKQGEGSPILLIHDCTQMSSEQEFTSILQQLSKHHTVYTMDLLGCGRSEKPKMTYTNFLYVQLFNDFIRNIIGEKTDIIASGYSSSFVTMACQMSPELYGNLMFVNPPSFQSLSKMPTKRHKFLKYFLELPLIGTVVYNMNNSLPQIKKELDHNIFYAYPNIKASYVKLCHEAAHKEGSSSKYFYASLRSHFMNMNIVQGLKALNNNIYVVTGNCEPNQQQIMKEYRECNPLIEVSTIRHAKHLPHLEHPKEFLEICSVFFCGEDIGE